MIPRFWTLFALSATIHMEFLFLVFSFPCYERTTFVQVRHSLYITLQTSGFLATFMSANSFVAASSLHGASCLRILSLSFTILGLLFFFCLFFILFHAVQALTLPGSGIKVSISIRRSRSRLLSGLGFLFAWSSVDRYGQVREGEGHKTKTKMKTNAELLYKGIGL